MKQKEEFLNSQGCTNIEGAPITRRNQAENLGKTTRVGQMNSERLGPRSYYEFFSTVPKFNFYTCQPYVHYSNLDDFTWISPGK